MIYKFLLTCSINKLSSPQSVVDVFFLFQYKYGDPGSAFHREKEKERDTFKAGPKGSEMCSSSQLF